MHNQVAVTPYAQENLAAAKELANQLNLNFLENMKKPEALDFDYLLVVSSQYIGLQNPHEKKFNPFYIDFLSSSFNYRVRHIGLRKELIAKALGMHPQDNPIILDATAGLGRDSFILAALGFNITMLERSSILNILLKNALKRAEQDAKLAPIVKRLALIQADSVNWLKEHASHFKPDIIYLDPMFPERQKTASVKKEMVILRKMLLNDDNLHELFEVAFACAKKRIVVKRPRLAAYLMEQKPNFSLMGRSSRFDIYLV